jgi:hypothetical protein
MNRLGARDFEIVALSMDAERGLAALAYAQTKGADNPIAYAIKLFDSNEWQPRGENRRLLTNVSVDKRCDHCGGDRFVPVDAGLGLYEETYAPCVKCNANANTEFWTVRGEKHVTEAR